MVRIALIVSSLFCADAPAPAGVDDALKAYAVEASKASRDADSQFRLALWCEAHGLNPERAKHLALAVLRDPGHAAARGLMGLLPYRGKWESPDSVSAKIKADEALTAKLAEYNARREKLEKATRSPPADSIIGSSPRNTSSWGCGARRTGSRPRRPPILPRAVVLNAHTTRRPGSTSATSATRAAG